MSYFSPQNSPNRSHLSSSRSGTSSLSPFFDRTRTPAADERSSGSVRALTERQQGLISNLLNKNVHIVSRDKSVSLHPPAYEVINKFIQSFLNLYFAQEYVFNHEPLFPSPDIQKSRICYLHPAVTVRGSTTSIIASDTEPKADLDIIIKFSNTGINTWGNPFFKEFCKLVGVHAVEMLFPTDKHRQSVYLNTQTASYTSTYEGLKLTDITNGVFKNIFSFYDNSKCIYSFEGMIDQAGEMTGVDIDIALQFSSDMPNIAINPESPLSQKTFSTESEDLTIRPDSACHRHDSQSFAHDAVEIVLSRGADRIDFATRFYFSGLFGWNIDQVEKVIQRKELIILDPKMHEGYKRIFYEMTRGKLSPSNVDATRDPEINKIIQAICLIRENSATTIKPSLDSFLKFIIEKSSCQEHSFRFFLNGYTCAYILKEHLKELHSPTHTKAAELEKIKSILKLFERDIIHDQWQRQFPAYACKVSTQPNSLRLLMYLAELQSHFNNFDHVVIKESLGNILRLSTNADNPNFFAITKCKSFDQLRLILAFLNNPEHLDTHLYTELVLPMIEPISAVSCQGLDKWLLMYFLCRLNQNQLTHFEISQMSKDFPQFLRLWIAHADELVPFELEPKMVLLLKSHASLLFGKKIDNHMLHATLRCCESYLNNNPQFLPSLLYLFHKVTEVNIDDDMSLMNALEPIKRHTRDIARVLIETQNSGLLRFDPVKDILKYLAFLSPHLNRELSTQIPALLNRSISPLYLDTFAPIDYTSVCVLTNRLMHEDLEEQVLKLKNKLSLILDIDIHKILQKNPLLVSYLKEEEISDIFISSLSEENYTLTEQLCTYFPARCLELCLDLLQKSTTLHAPLVHKIETSLVMKELLLSKVSWLLPMTNINETLAFQYFLKLKSPHLKSQVATFLQSMLSTNPEFALKCALNTGPQLQKILLENSTKKWTNLLLQNKDLLNNDQREQIMRTLTMVDSSKATTRNIALLSAELICKCTNDKKYQIELLSDLVNRYLPTIRMMTEENNLSLIKIYPVYISKVAHLLEHSYLVEPSKTLLKQERYELCSDNIAFSEYFDWAKKQPRSEKISTSLIGKIQLTTPSAESISELAIYFEDSISYMEDLVSIATKSNIPLDQVAGLQERIIELETNLDKQLKNLYSLAVKENSSLDLQNKQISHLNTECAMEEAERVLLMRCAKQLMKNDLSLFKSLISKVNTSSFLGSENKNYRSIISLVANNIDLSREEWGLEQIYKTLILNDMIASSQTLSLIKDPLLPSQSPPLFTHFNRCVAGSFLLRILDLALFKENRGPYGFKYEDTFYEIIRTIIKNGPMDEHSAIEHNKLKIQFIMSYLPRILNENPDSISEFILNANKHDLLSLLDRLNNTNTLLSLRLSQDLLQAFINLNITPETTSQKAHFLKCLQTIFKSDDPDVLLRTAKIYLSIMPKDAYWPAIYQNLFSKATEMQSLNLLQWLAEHVELGLSIRDTERKKKIFRDGLYTLASTSSPSEAPCIINIITHFHSSTNLNIKPILIDFLHRQLVTKSSQQEILQAIDMIKLITSNKHFILTPQESLEIGEKIRIYFQDLSFDLYLANIDIFLYTQNTCYVLRPCSTALLHSHIVRLIRHAISGCEFVEKRVILGNIHEILWREYKKGIPLLPELKSFVGMYIQEMVQCEHLSPEQTYNMTVIFGLYCLVIFRGEDAEKPENFCRTILPYVSKENFHFVDDDLFLESFARIVVQAKAFAYLEPIIDNMYTRSCSSELSLQEADCFYCILYKNLIPIYIGLDDSVRIPTGKIISLTQMLLKKKALEGDDVKILVWVFHKYITNLISPSGYPDTTPFFISIPVFEALGLRGGIQKLVQSRAILECFNILSPHIKGTLPIPILSQIAHILLMTSSSPSLITRDVLEELPKIMEQTAQTMISHRELEESISEFESRRGYFSADGTKNEMLDIYLAMVNLIPAFYQNIHAVRLSYFPEIPEYDNKKLVRCYSEFMQKIDDRLVATKPLTAQSLTVFTKLAKPSMIEFLLKFHLHFMSKAKDEKNIDKILSFLRISTGFCLTAASLEKTHLRRIADQTSESAAENITGRTRMETPETTASIHLNDLSIMIFEEMERCLDKCTQMRSSKIKDLAILSFLNIDANEEIGFTIFSKIFNTCISEELKKRTPDIQVINVLIVLMFNLYCKPDLRIELKVAAHDKIIKAKKSLPPPILNAITRSANGELQKILMQNSIDEQSAPDLPNFLSMLTGFLPGHRK